MIRFLLLSSMRRLVRYKAYCAINLLGLSLGIASVWLVSLYVSRESSYDRFVPGGESIYRFAFVRSTDGNVNHYCNVPMPVGPAMKEEFSDIEAMVRMRGVNALNTHNSFLKYDERLHFTGQIFFADSTFFDVFDYPMLQGDPTRALSAPNTMVISESLAKRVAGDEPVMGKTIRFQWGQQYYNATITGILRDLPSQTHLHIEALVSWETQGFGTRYNQQWKGAHVYTYIKTRPGLRPEELEARFPGFYGKYMKEQYDREGTTGEFSLQPLHSIHLDSSLMYEAYQNGSRRNIRMFSLLGLLLLTLAVINYINNTTANSLTRAREVAINKLHGATRMQIVGQMLAESLVLSVIATLIAAVAVALLLPQFNNFTGQAHRILSGNPLAYGGFILLLTLATGLISGILPALFIAGFNPLAVLRGTLGFSAHRGRLRKLLVTLQLIISAGLIASTILIVKQYRLALGFDPGFDRENMMVIEVRDSAISNRLPTIRERLAQIPGVTGITSASNIPGATTGQALVSSLREDGSVGQIDCQYMWADYDFVPVMGIRLTHGRNFGKSFASDTTGMILNQTAIEKLGWNQNPLRCELSWGEYTPGKAGFHTVGVMENLMLGSIHSEIPGLILFAAEVPLSVKMYLLIRFDPVAAATVPASVHKTLQGFSADYYPEHQYLEGLMKQQYRSEQKMMVLFLILTALNILIAVLGLLALTSFTLYRRGKELVIRKVWGASSLDNLLLVSREFLAMILVSNLVAAPAAWFLMTKWLANFAYRTNLDPLVFATALIISLVICFSTISWILWRTVRKNPAAILRT